MRRLAFAAGAFLAGFLASCERKSDFITETSPFVSEYVRTPEDGHAEIAKRAAEFASRHGMKRHYVPGHFKATEFTISVTREDLDIGTGNVKLGNRTLVTAYTQGSPTEKQRAEVREFMCAVMLHGCGGREN